MSQTVTYYFHLPVGLAGDVHIVVHSDAASMPQLPEVGPAPSGPVGLKLTPPEPTVPSGAEAMLARFVAYDPTSKARLVYEAAIAAGWMAFTPEPRGGKTKSDAAYVRFVYDGSARKATVYLNTNSVFTTGAKEKAVMAQLPGADVRTDVYVAHKQLDQALDALDAIRRWADGEPA
jgi:hypothetical protein